MTNYYFSIQIIKRTLITLGDHSFTNNTANSLFPLYCLEEPNTQFFVSLFLL